MASILDTIIAKSDQLNADDLIGAPRTIRVSEVRFTGAEQPVAIHYEGDGGKPFMACKSMRRVLVNVWGPDANAYVGKSMTLYRDPNVKFGGQAVGGIRISHMSHIDRDVTMALTESRANRKPFVVKPLKDGPANAPGSRRPGEAPQDAASQPDAPKAAHGLAERVARAEAVLGKVATADELDATWAKMAGLIADAGPTHAATLKAARDRAAERLSGADDEPSY